MAHDCISLCMIVKNEEQVLEACLESVFPFVQEICILDTGSTDRTMEIARKYTDKVVQDLSFNDDRGNLRRFDSARQASLKMASHDWILWLDADDILVGGEHLSGLLCTSDPINYHFDYEYGHDEYGNVITRLDRERLCFPAKKLAWKGAVHETLVNEAGGRDVRIDNIKVVHRRSLKGPSKDPERNLRILENEVLGSYPRSLFYLAREYNDNGHTQKAIKFFEKYIEFDTWDEERYSALCDLSDLYVTLGDYQRAQSHAFSAVSLNELWPGAYFQLCKLFYMKALKSENYRDWERCVHYGKISLACPEFVSVFPQQRINFTYTIHLYMNFAYSKLGMFEDALSSARLGLSVRPDDKDLSHNIEFYQQKLGLSSPEVRPKITFYTDMAFENWDPSTIEASGNGGSEIAMVRIAQELHNLGHEVEVFNPCSQPMVFGGVQYTPHTKFTGCESGVFISSRGSQIFDIDIHADLSIAWIHDLNLWDLSYIRSIKIDKFFCLSEWHKNWFLSENPYLSENHVLVTRNGIRTSDFSFLPEKTPNRFIWTSSPDRGLEYLLRQVWPEVIKAKPDSTLHVYYGFDNMEKLADQKSELYKSYVRDLKYLVDTSKNVVYHGRVAPKKLSEAFLKSTHWAYPTDFQETSCISAMEAMASGLNIIYTPVGALPETVGSRGICADRVDFTQKVLQTLDSGVERSVRAYAMKHLDWSNIAKEWSAMFNSMMDEKKSRVVPVMGVI